MTVAKEHESVAETHRAHPAQRILVLALIGVRADDFADAAEMAAALRPDVISVCTPARGRAAAGIRATSA